MPIALRSMTTTELPQKYSRLSDLTPDALFEARFLEKYRRLHSDIWNRMVLINGTVVSLEAVERFPFHYLYAPNEIEFWRLVHYNFSFTACVMLHALVGDQEEDAHTIRRFKNEIANEMHWLDANHRASFFTGLRELAFDDQVNLVKRVTDLRNNRLAHRLIDRASGDFAKSVSVPSTAELRKLFDQCKSLFDYLSFNLEYVTLGGDYMPSTVGGQPQPTSLDRLFDAMLKDSNVVREPELKEGWWSVMRSHRSPEELSIMNQCRRRIGLPDA